MSGGDNGYRDGWFKCCFVADLHRGCTKGSLLAWAQRSDGVTRLNVEGLWFDEVWCENGVSVWWLHWRGCWRRDFEDGGGLWPLKMVV